MPDEAPSRVLPRTMRRVGDALILLDQRALPGSVCEVRCSSAAEVAVAIREMVVRGAPAIGVAAAHGVALAARAAARAGGDIDAVRAATEEACLLLEGARPTAVNLGAAVTRMRRLVLDSATLRSAGELAAELEVEAAALERFEVDASHAMGRLGADLLPDGARVLVHCNTGALAAIERGTALAVVYEAHHRATLDHVFVGETRPRLQGSRLTAFELAAAGIPHTIVVDSLAASLMLHGAVDAVLVGADRIAANGDVANKVGTYGLAVSCAHHHVPLHVVAPTSTLDMSCASGREIPIEERAGEEVTVMDGRRLAPAASRALNPAFDVTPASLVTALVTERGVVSPVSEATVARLAAARVS